jgi:hypothetical protein
MFSIEFSADQIIAVLLTLREHTYLTKKGKKKKGRVLRLRVCLIYLKNVFFFKYFVLTFLD